MPPVEGSVPGFDSFVRAYHAHFARDPNQRLALGLTEDIGRLPDPSAAARLDGVREAQALLRQLDGFQDLDFDASLDRDLARLGLENEIHHDTLAFGGRLEAVQRPRVGDSIGEPLFQLMVSDPRPAHERLQDVLGRLEDVPRFTAASLAELDRPVARWTMIDRQVVSGLPELFGNLLQWARKEAFVDALRMERAVAEAKRSLQSYDAGLGALETTDAFHLEGDDAARVVALRGIGLSLDELHQLAIDFLRSNAEQVEALRARLAPRYGLAKDASNDEVGIELKRRFPALRAGEPIEAILDRYREESAGIVAFIQARDLFPIPEGQELLIVRTPPFMVPSIPAGAMASPPAFREGTRRSVVYLTLDADRVGEHTNLDIPMMMVHEGIPGHHLQLATASFHPSIVRRHAAFMDQAEGWTTMLEDYMLDVGFCPDRQDEMRFIAKRDIARIGARVAIDLFFMTGDRGYLDVGMDADTSAADPFEAAGSLLRAVTGFGPGRISAELNFYSLERGYPLSYLAGNHLVWQLKQDVAAAQKGRVQGLVLDRLFHRTFLEAGNMPVSFLRRVFGHAGLLPEA
jgi:uncharacterized protein (DUF885 family)